MDNHYHVFICTPRANLSQAMQWINATHAARIRSRHKLFGHLFQGRFKSVVVLDESYWLHLSMYIHLNPVRGGLVEDPSKYTWSSCRDYFRTKQAYAFVSRSVLLDSYGKSPAAAVRNYRKQCLDLAGTSLGLLDDLKYGIALGSEEALAKLAKKHKPAGDRGMVPSYSLAAGREVDVQHELARIAKAFGVEVRDLMHKRRNFPAKQAAYYHLAQNCGLMLSEVTQALGVGRSSVSDGVRKFRERLETDPEMVKVMDAVKRKTET